RRCAHACAAVLADEDPCRPAPRMAVRVALSPVREAGGFADRCGNRSARDAAAAVRCPRRQGVRRVGTDDSPWAASSGCLIWTAGPPLSTIYSVLPQPPLDRRRAA